MSRVVWKFPLQPGITAVEIGGFPRIVHVAPTVPGADGPAVWIEHDPSSDRWQLRLAVVGTGHPVPVDAQHRGSAWCGEFMWHVYELPT